VEVVEGDARNVLCDTVEKYHASILVVGSHGYGAIKRYGFIVVTIIVLWFGVIGNCDWTTINNFSESCEWDIPWMCCI